MSGPRARSGRAVLATALAAAAWLAPTGAASAAITPAVEIEPPSSDVVGFGGVAMAEDGTGGLVFLKRVDGVAHVFVARYVGGSWQPPIRVDVAQPYAASWPRIGAADGGQLEVVWVTPYASEDEQPVDELLGAGLGPGASSFGPAQVVDHDVGDGDGSAPDLAMSPNGQADVVYRVLPRASETSVSALRAGDVAEEVRLSHFLGEQWSEPELVNDDPGVAMRAPAADNAPQVAIGADGNGLVVWQEPDASGVARIWARRVFGGSVDYAMPVSATSYAGRAIGTDADSPSVSLTGGEAVVAYRQQAGPGSPLAASRVFLDVLPNGIAEEGTQFRGAVVEEPPGVGAGVGPPAVAMDGKRRMRLLYGQGSELQVATGEDGALSPTLSIGGPLAPAGDGGEVAPATVTNPSGGGVSAWPSTDAAGDPGVAIREDYPDGSVQTALAADATGGPIAALAVAGSGLGDGLIAFQQGPLGDAAILAVRTTAVPAKLTAAVPQGWIRPAQARIEWEPIESASPPLTYTVILDGHPLPTPQGSFSLALDRRRLGDGVHVARVLVTDGFGESSLTQPLPVMIDTAPPAVRIRTAEGGRAVAVRVSDSQSGVAAASVTVGFGDGSGARGRTRYLHLYRHPGSYTVVVRARDRLGNAALVRRRVRIG